ncbi:MAG: ATP-binding protein [Rectinemataceae bacterium]
MDEIGNIVSTVILESRIRGERSIAKLRLVLAFILLATMISIFLESVSIDGLATELRRPIYYLEALGLFLCALVSIVILKITSQGRYSSWMRFIPSFLDVSCVSVTHWVMSSTIVTSLAFTGAVAWFYALIIAMSVFRYSSISVVFTGAYSAAALCTINTFMYSSMGNFAKGANRYMNAAGRVVRLDFDDEVVKVLVLLLLTGLLTVVSERFKQMVQEQIKVRIDRENSVRQASEAEHANVAKSAFLANMSHELRTPLNAILGFAQLMARSGTLDREQQGNIATITTSATQLLALINGILDMSKIEAGREELNPSAFDLHGMLADLESLFSLRAREKGLTLLVDLIPETPRYIFSDEGKLRQVLVNLLGNAIKFTTEGGGTSLRVRSSRSEAMGNVRLFFEVEDSGVGIQADEIGSLFEPFVQSKSASVAQEGTGLGLAICRKYVSLMGGAISAQSEPGKGSVFSFDVQVGLADETQISRSKPRRRVKCLAPGQAKYRILIAEDRDSNRELLMKLLMPLGFEVRGVRNGAECVSMWESWEPQLIWMDMRMPVMDGYEATRRIKSSARGQATVIIALTASAFASDRNLILSEGCDDFVRKPFVEEDIYTALEKHLGVTFLVEEDGGRPVGEVAPLALMRELLIPVAETWRSGFRTATVEADYARLQQLLFELRPLHPEAAAALGPLVSGFEYEKILAALDGSA